MIGIVYTPTQTPPRMHFFIYLVPCSEFYFSLHKTPFPRLCTWQQPAQNPRGQDTISKIGCFVTAHICLDPSTYIAGQGFPCRHTFNGLIVVPPLPYFQTLCAIKTSLKSPKMPGIYTETHTPLTAALCAKV